MLNIRRRTTQGLTVDFSLLNVLGFACYTVFTATFLFSTSIRQQYAARHPHAPEPTVRGNDFAFAVHALVLCVMTYSQFWHRLWGFEAIPGKRASRAAVGIFWGSLLGVAVTAMIAFTASAPEERLPPWGTLDIVSSLQASKTRRPPDSCALDLRNLLCQVAHHLLQVRAASMAQLQTAINGRLGNQHYPFRL